MDAASTAVAAGAAGTPEAELFDQEAATICATPMLLQFLRALMLSWRTKFGGNLKIREDMPRDDDARLAGSTPIENRAEPGLSWRVEPENSGSERHSNEA